jgi:hypothetical protein
LARRSIRKKQNTFYWLLLGTLGTLSIIIIYSFMNLYNGSAVNARYGRPFEERARNFNGTSKSYTSTPNHAPGMREAEIRKHQGRRYETY